MAAAMGAMVWQRRPRLAKLKLEGFPRARAVAHDPARERAAARCVGCLSGALLGLSASSCSTARSANVINFPVVRSVRPADRARRAGDRHRRGARRARVPGYLAAACRPALALQD